jgi:adenylate cyclase
MGQARRLFEKAITLDPSYAIAYASLGWVCFHEWSFQRNPDPQMLEQMFALAQKAVTLDDSVPPAHELLAWVYLFRDKQHEAALAEINRALAYGGPNWFSAYLVLGHLLNFAGRPEEAIALREQAMRLSPRSADYLLVLGNAYALTGRYEEAITTHQQILTFLPDFLDAHLGLAAIYSQLGREEEARTEAAEVLRLNSQFSLEGLRQRMPYKDPAIVERALNNLRKAGLK